jgi:error-prone DNA polymerase
MQYVELHARSAFTFLEGASLPEWLASVCAKYQMPAMALVDRNGVYGSPRFHLAAKRYKIKAHVGAEISVAGHGNCPVLVESRTGYQNLCRLLTTAKLRADKKVIATVTLEELQSHAEGLICLTGDENGPLAHALQDGGLGAARRLLQQLTSIFGQDNLYVELQRHFNRFQESRNQSAVTLAREFHLPLLATNGVCYGTPREREIADVFTCIKNKRRLDTAGRLLSQNSHRYIKDAAKMARIFADLPEAIANTVELSSRLEFTLEKLGYEFPRYSVPDGETMNSFLYKRVWDGAKCRYQPVTQRAREQLERELALIAKLDLAGYFLIVWDIIRFCARNGILVQGRGSAANSAVCYSLGITAVDPISMELLFERFLSEERGEWPDIDLDLPSGDQREQVIQYVYECYGKRGAAMTANVCTYRGRSAAREVGKALGFDEDSLSRLSKIVGAWEWKDPEETLEKQSTKVGLDIRHPQIALYVDLCQRVQDLPRHLSQHSGGMVICQGQLDSVVPLEPATMPGRVVVQWDKDDCAALGLVKVDLLGLGMMSVLKDSIELIRDHYKEEIDLAHLSQEAAPDVYETIQKADTIGMFQIESRAQMASLPRNNPTRFYDLVTQVALIRPGPITGKMTNPYLKRRQGKEAVSYPHPSLEPVLKRTLGVPLFQEQLLKMAMVCANFSGGEAEELRRALGSKRSRERMREIETKLRSGMKENKFPLKTQDEIVQFIASFALYGFPESHAASFALIAYASAFLKVRYLAAFTAALLNNYPMGFYHPSTIVKDAQRHGLRVKPVDVMCSAWDCTIEHDQSQSLRLGFRYVKGLKRTAADALIVEREKLPFQSISDIGSRVPELSKTEFKTLAQIGAFNNIEKKNGIHRRDALWQSQKAAQAVGPLFADIPESDGRSPLDRMSTTERLVADYSGTGLSVDRHPLFYRRKELQATGVKTAGELAKMRDGANVCIAGCVITRQRPGTAHGFIFLTLEDETGIANAIITPSFYSENTMTVLHERFVFIEGVLQNKDNVIHVRAEKIMSLAALDIQIPARNFH